MNEVNFPEKTSSGMHIGRPNRAGDSTLIGQYVRQPNSLIY